MPRASQHAAAAAGGAAAAAAVPSVPCGTAVCMVAVPHIHGPCDQTKQMLRSHNGHIQSGAGFRYVMKKIRHELMPRRPTTNNM